MLLLFWKFAAPPPPPTNEHTYQFSIVGDIGVGYIFSETEGRSRYNASENNSPTEYNLSKDGRIIP